MRDTYSVNKLILGNTGICRKGEELLCILSLMLSLITFLLNRPLLPCSVEGLTFESIGQLVGLEPAISIFERSKTVLPLDRSAIETGIVTGATW
jgi:hypothetical protein